MRLKIDHETDALYLTLDESDAVESEEVSPGIIVDYNAENHVVGIEMLYLSKRTPKLDTRKLLFEMVPALGSHEVSQRKRRWCSPKDEPYVDWEDRPNGEKGYAY